ncbi:hypothetical protein [Nocardioides piscis]|uniref:Uncharacterized protein n=1 Tax=Nocardioides piscis TaxID=2714938 RepID=A0A6G7YJB8_9ACTN|nr:hypothetical protein [Nocardioides piscis]QIK76832.1 hypothetical protein G7071_16755 [Nocardioides piscis]
MSSTAVTRSQVGVTADRPLRVREQARDAIALMAFSATASVGLTVMLFVLAQLGR